MISEDSSLAGFFLSLSSFLSGTGGGGPSQSHGRPHLILGKIYPGHDSCVRQSPTAMPKTTHLSSFGLPFGRSGPSLQELVYYTKFLQDVSVQTAHTSSQSWDTDGTKN